jgi:K+-transporting ATPase c subunit
VRACPEYDATDTNTAGGFAAEYLATSFEQEQYLHSRHAPAQYTTYEAKYSSTKKCYPK